MTIDYAKMRALLLARRRSLHERLAEIDETLRQPEDADVEEQVADISDDEVLMRLSSTARDEEHLIRAALKRIDDGSYGKCFSCGNPIEPRRLEAIPETERCLSCARGGNKR